MNAVGIDENGTRRVSTPRREGVQAMPNVMAKPIDVCVARGDDVRRLRHERHRVETRHN